MVDSSQVPGEKICHGDVLTSAALTSLHKPTAGFMTDSFLSGTLRAALLPLF